MLWLVVVAAQCPCVHALVCHIPPPQSSFAQGVLVASQGYKIARQSTTLRLPKGAMQKGQQSKLTVCGLDPLTPLPKIEAWSQGNYQDILNIQTGMCKKCVQCKYRCIMYTTYMYMYMYIWGGQIWGGQIWGCQIWGGQFGEAKFGEAKFGEAKFGEAKFGQAKFGEAKFGEAKFGDSKFGEAKFGDAKFGDAKFGDAKFGEAKFGGQGSRGDEERGQERGRGRDMREPPRPRQ